MNIIF
jgi:hypothetical protein